MAPDPQVRALAGELARLQKRISQIERNQRASMGPVSVAAGSMTFTDAAGTPQLTVGQQPDGTFGAVSVTQQAPAQPDQPLAGPGILGIWAYWDGQFADGTGPRLDFAAVQVHASAQAGFTPSAATLQGTLTGPGLFGIGNLTAGTTYYVAFLAVNQAGNASAPSAYAQATAQAVPDFIPPGTISGLQMQTGTLTAAQLAQEAGILGSQIAQNTITDANIQAGTITANSIASDTITAAQIVAGIIIAGIIDGTTVTAATFTGSVFQGTGFVINSSGAFFYSGTPAPGNMTASVSSTAGTDPKGNAWLAGIVKYSPSGTGYYIATQLSGASGVADLIWYTAATEAGPWTQILDIGSDSSGNLNFTTSGTVDLFGTGRVLLPATQIGNVRLDGLAAEALKITLNMGLAGYVPLVLTDVSVKTNANLSGAQQLTVAWNISAGDAQAGTEYEIEMPFSCTVEGQALTLGLSIDGSATYAASDTIGAAIVSAGNGLNGTIRVHLKITATGTSGAYTAWVNGSFREQGGNALFTNSANLAQAPATGSIDTTAAHNVRVNSTWGALAAGQTVSGYGSAFTRKGP